MNGIGVDKAAQMRMIHVLCAFVVHLQSKIEANVYPRAGKSYCFKHTACRKGKIKAGRVIIGQYMEIRFFNPLYIMGYLIPIDKIKNVHCISKIRVHRSHFRSFDVLYP